MQTEERPFKTVRVVICRETFSTASYDKKRIAFFTTISSLLKRRTLWPAPSSCWTFGGVMMEHCRNCDVFRKPSMGQIAKLPGAEKKLKWKQSHYSTQIPRARVPTKRGRKRILQVFTHFRNINCLSVISFSQNPPKPKVMLLLCWFKTYSCIDNTENQIIITLVVQQT